jgi:hypothetical protein
MLDNFGCATHLAYEHGDPEVAVLVTYELRISAV